MAWRSGLFGYDLQQLISEYNKQLNLGISKQKQFQLINIPRTEYVEYLLKNNDELNKQILNNSIHIQYDLNEDFYQANNWFSGDWDKFQELQQYINIRQELQELINNSHITLSFFQDLSNFSEEQRNFEINIRNTLENTKQSTQQAEQTAKTIIGKSQSATVESIFDAVTYYQFFSGDPYTQTLLQNYKYLQSLKFNLPRFWKDGDVVLNKKFFVKLRTDKSYDEQLGRVVQPALLVQAMASPVQKFTKSEKFTQSTLMPPLIVKFTIGNLDNPIYVMRHQIIDNLEIDFKHIDDSNIPRIGELQFTLQQLTQQSLVYSDEDFDTIFESKYKKQLPNTSNIPSISNILFE